MASCFLWSLLIYSVNFQLAGEDPKDLTCQTYILNEEDHTIGNALRWMIMKK